MNICVFVGRLTADIDVRDDRNGDAYGLFSIAVQRKGNDKDKADFIRCMVFGKGAEIIEKYTKKGDMLAVEGSINIDDSDGEYRGRATLMVDKFTLVGSRSRDDDDRGSRDDRRSGGRSGDRSERSSGRSGGRSNSGGNRSGGRSNSGGRSSGSGRSNDRSGGSQPDPDEYDPFADD